MKHAGHLHRRNEQALAVILGNPVMIDAYRAGIPQNGKPFPDGAKRAKVHWAPKPNEFFPNASVPGNLQNVELMVKDSKRFADSDGWGYAVFDYDAASDTFKPGTMASKPPQGNDGKCGFTCHTSANARDYVFTDYGRRLSKRRRRKDDSRSRAPQVFAGWPGRRTPVLLAAHCTS